MESILENTTANDEATIAKCLHEWGVPAEETSPELLQYAKLTSVPGNSRIGDVIVRFGLASREEIEKYAASKPGNVPLLEHLCERIDNLRSHSLKLLAANDKIAFYNALENPPLHSAFHSDKTLRLFCEELSCLPLLAAQGASLRLVFADYSTMKEYSQRARIARANDPIGQLCAKSEMPLTIIYGLAQRDAISAQFGIEDGDYSNVSDDEDKLSFWSDTSAITPAQKILARILAIAVEKRASNIAFKPVKNGQVEISYRRHGLLHKIPGIRSLSLIQADEINRFLHIKSIARNTDTGKRIEGRLLGPADGQFVFRTATSETFLRCSYIPVATDGLSYTMESISIRLLPRNTMSISLKDMNIAPSLIRQCKEHMAEPHGLILLVGPTSSGKSTTIAGMIDLHIDLFGDSRNRLSLEQPVERYIDGVTQFNVHKSGFELAMSALLRHDPDLIWVGELRDRPTAATCVRASNTGHIVLSTLHADDAPSAYNALLSYIRNTTSSSAESVMVTEYDAINSMSLIIAQRLVPELCPNCKKPLSANPDIYSLRMMQLQNYCTRHGYTEPKTNIEYYEANPHGCDTCDHQGYIGELPINEPLPFDDLLRKALADMANAGRFDLKLLERNRPYTLHEDAMRLVGAGRVALTEALI